MHFAVLPQAKTIILERFSYVDIILSSTKWEELCPPQLSEVLLCEREELVIRQS